MTARRGIGKATGGGLAGSSEPAPPTRQGRGRPRRDQAGAIERDLLRHALDHFLAKGYEGTTLSAITLSLGMSKQTVYNRYPDKHALFIAALQSAVDDWLAPIAGLPDCESDDLEATLNAVARLIVSTLLSPAGLRLIRITNAESFRMPEIGRHTYGKGHAMIAVYLRDLFERRLRAGGHEREDLDDLVTAFLNLMSGPARLNAWGLDAEPIDVAGFVARRVSLFLDGVRGGSR